MNRSEARVGMVVVYNPEHPEYSEYGVITSLGPDFSPLVHVLYDGDTGSKGTHLGNLSPLLTDDE